MGGSRWSSTVVGSSAISPDGRGASCSSTSRCTARAVTRDELTEAIWQDEPPPGARGTLCSIISRLRGALGGDVLDGRDELRLVLPADAFVDTEVAAEKIHEAEAAVHREDWGRGVAASSIAYAICGRGFLPEEDAPWVVEHRRWLEDVLLRAIECDAIGSLGIGGTELAAAERDARRLMRLAPYKENGYRLLMRSLGRKGERAEALLHEQLRTVLRDELGATPSPVSQAVHRGLLGDSA